MRQPFTFKALGVALLLLALAGTVRADADPLVLHSTPTSGGGVLPAGVYRRLGAIGQPAVGSLRAGDLELSSGVILGGVTPRARVYLPLVRRQARSPLAGDPTHGRAEGRTA